MGALFETLSIKIQIFAESGKLHLDRAGSIGLGFGPFVFNLWASLLSPLFQHRFFYDFGLPRGHQKVPQVCPTGGPRCHNGVPRSPKCHKDGTRPTTKPKCAPRCQKTSKHTQTQTTNLPNKQRGAQINKPPHKHTTQANEQTHTQTP